MRLDINLTSGIFDNANAILSFSLASTSKPTNAKEGFSILLILLITEILITSLLINFFTLFLTVPSETPITAAI